MNEICGDNRFEIIEKAKMDILDSTNISSSQDEMKVLDSFLFRCWQMRWLKKYDNSQPQTNADRIRAMSDEELVDFLGEYRFCDICDEGCEACTYHGDCNKRLFDWLKQPAEGE